jgi:hypothetical protein
MSVRSFVQTKHQLAAAAAAASIRGKIAIHHLLRAKGGKWAAERPSKQQWADSDRPSSLCSSMFAILHLGLTKLVLYIFVYVICWPNCLYSQFEQIL